MHVIQVSLKPLKSRLPAVVPSRSVAETSLERSDDDPQGERSE